MPQDRLALGRSVYNFRCYFCHGYSGDAKTLAASFLSPPPRNLIATTPETLPEAKIADAVRIGRPGTAMKPFAGILSEAELSAVTHFVYREFVVAKARNTRYHTPENGWPDHERYRSAFPFALGEIPMTAPTDSLTREQLAGRQLFATSCVTCHDRGAPTEDSTIWEARPVSYPRFNYDHRNPAVDATTSATPYRIHDTPPTTGPRSPAQAAGMKLFQDNCAFCHAADGTGKNWIGSFLEPHPRNLTDPAFMRGMTATRLATTISNGLPGTSMPAWKSVLSARDIDQIVAYIGATFYPLAGE